MKILNLVDIKKSDIKYHIQKFPDGQQNIVILGIPKFKKEMWVAPENTDSGWNWVEDGITLNISDSVNINSRLNNFKDLEIIVAAIASLKELGIEDIHLYVPYFIGARSDRKFEEGGNWYLKQVICPIINSLNLRSVTVLDPHSYVLGNLLNNFKGIDNEQLVRFALCNLYCPAMENNSLFTPGLESEDREGSFILISPDAGASHKIQKIADKIGYKGNIITCSKKRDTEGNLTRTVVPLEQNSRGDMGSNLHKDLIIIDDICDGGRTFINIAQAIHARYKMNGFDKEEYPKIYLIVTHGIFSAGFSELSEYFDGIYCTNSYSNIGDYAGNDLQKTNLKQLNVF